MRGRDGEREERVGWGLHSQSKLTGIGRGMLVLGTGHEFSDPPLSPHR